MKLLKKIWHAVVPEKVREFLWFLRCPDKKRFLEEKRNFKKVRNDFKNGNYNKENEKELLYMIEKKRPSVFPYSWTGDYSPDDVKVQFDEKKGMHYVNRCVWGGGGLYFPKNWSLEQIKGYYSGLNVEQDSRSPHLYFKNGTDFISGKTFVDVGAAEAMSSLDVVKKAKRVVMFECEPNWIEALNATFEPWKEKVTIVPKFAGDVDDEKTVRLDSFFADVPADEKIALKLDVEGMEKKVLDGAQKILQKNATDLFVCTYHKHGDFEELGALIAKYGFSQSVSDGFMFFEHEFRHGIIRAVK